MNRQGYRSSIPARAKEVVIERHEDGTKSKTNHFIGRRMVGRRYWYDGEWYGGLEIEYGVKRGKKHGNECHFAPNGKLTFVEPFINGRVHGTAKQWSSDGQLLITYTLRDGRGLDLWCHEDGSLAEEHYLPKPDELGYSRWWSGDNTSISWEYYYRMGRYHGITREWNNKKRLSRAYPQYWVDGQQVTKRQYLRACESDALLPKFRSEENKPFRPLPSAYCEQRGRDSDCRKVNH